MGKYIVLLLYILCFCSKPVLSQNLIPNPGFESYTSCPIIPGQIDTCDAWFSASIGSPDYFNECGLSMVDIPYNIQGFQTTHSGEAYAGIMLYSNNFGIWREYLEVQLTSPLVAGSCYELKMWVNLSNSSSFRTDDIGVFFSDTMLITPTLLGINVTPQITNPTGVFPDSSNWMQITGLYTAAGGENYIVIGNFVPDSSITLDSVFASTYPFSYIYVDDVQLTLCVTSLVEQQQDMFSVYPNPVSDKLFINHPLGSIHLKLFNTSGSLVYETTTNDKEITLPVPTGFYIYEITGATNRKHYGKLIRE